MTADQPANPKPKLRWFHPTPGRLLVVLLAAEGLLLLSERFHWFAFNEKKGWTVLIAVAAVGVFLLLMLFWFIVSLIFRWRFQFSIRSLLVLTIAVAIPASWLAVEMKWAREQREAVEALIKLGNASYDYQLDQMSSSGNLIQEETTPPVPAWLRKMVGDDFFFNVFAIDYFDKKPSDADIERLEGMTQLQFLVVSGGPVTDNGLRHLEGLKQLKTLDLRNTQVTDAGVQKLKKALPSCEILH